MQKNRHKNKNYFLKNIYIVVGCIDDDDDDDGGVPILLNCIEFKIFKVKRESFCEVIPFFWFSSTES